MSYFGFDKTKEEEFNRVNEDFLLKEIFQKGISINDDYIVYDENKSGGTGFIGLCKNKKDKKFYVLKTYQREEYSDIFKKEIEFALRLEKHPHIVYSQTALKEKDRVYLVMELVGKQPNNEKEDWKAATLTQELQKGISIEESYKWAIEFCRGMQYLNSIGMKSHQDIKPDNIFITEDSHIKISDFGFVTLKGEQVQIKGWSDYYYSPEHFMEDKELDVRSDIYSFGIVLYEMFNAGINPQSKTRIGKLKRKNNFIEVDKIKSRHCNEIIKKCLQPKQEDRYQTFKKLEDDLLKEAKKEINKDFEVEPAIIQKMTSEDYFYKGIGYQNIYYLEKAIGFKYFKYYHEEAIKYYDETIKIDPNYAYAYTNRGVIKSDLGQYKEAIKDYDKVIELKPNAYIYEARAYAYYMQGCFKEAIMDYSEAIKLDSNNIMLYYKRAELYKNDFVGNYEEAIRDYDEIIRIVSKDVVTYKNRGNANKNWLKYKTVYIGSLYPQVIKNKDIKKYHDYWECYYNLVYAYEKRGTAKLRLKRYKEAIKDYDEVIKIDPKNYYAYSMRGEAKADLKQYEEAIKDYDEAIKIHPGTAYVYIKRGFAKENLGKYEEAIKDYDEAIKINPRSAGDIKYINLEKLGKSFEYIKLILEEIIYNKKLIIINKEQISPYNELIEIYKKLGLEKEAKKFEEALNKIKKG